MNDLNAASLDDVKKWFRTYYGATNAVLVLAGDIDVATAKAKAQKYFGDIPPGPPITRPRDLGRGAHGVHARDDERPGRADAHLPRLEHAGARHRRTPTCWTWRRRCSAAARPRASTSGSSTTTRSSTTSSRRPERARARRACSSSRPTSSTASTSGRSRRRSTRSCSRFMAKGPTPGRARPRGGGARQLRARPRAHRRLRRQGRRARLLRGVRARSGLLSTIAARGRGGDARAGCGRSASAGSRRATTRSRCGRSPRITPPRPTPSIAARGLPVIDTYPGPDLPDARAREARERHPGHPRQPTERAGGASRRAVRCRLRGGSWAEAGHRRASRWRMLDEGTGQLDSLAIADRAKTLGAELSAGSALDTSRRRSLGAHGAPRPVARAARDAGAQPDVPAARDRSRAARMARRHRAGEDEPGRARRAVSCRRCCTATGIRTRSRSPAPAPRPRSQPLTREDLLAFQRDWLRPDNATLIVVGDTTLRGDHAGAREAVRRLERAGDTAAGQGDPRGRAARRRAFPDRQAGAVQSSILVGLVAPSSAAPNDLEIETMNDVFGGTFTSRLNMNLREDKHWAYGGARACPTRSASARGCLLRRCRPTRPSRRCASSSARSRSSSDRDRRRPTRSEGQEPTVRSLSGRYETNAAVAARSPT